MADDQLVARLTAAYKASGFKQKDLAEQLGVSVATVSKLLKGNVAKEAYWAPLAEAFEVSVEWLRDGVEQDSGEPDDTEAPAPDSDADGESVMDDVLESATRDLTASQLAVLLGMPLQHFEYDT